MKLSDIVAVELLGDEPKVTKIAAQINVEDVEIKRLFTNRCA